MAAPDHNYGNTWDLPQSQFFLKVLPKMLVKSMALVLELVLTVVLGVNTVEANSRGTVKEITNMP